MDVVAAFYFSQIYTIIKYEGMWYGDLQITGYETGLRK